MVVVVGGLGEKHKADASALWTFFVRQECQTNEVPGLAGHKGYMNNAREERVEAYIGLCPVSSWPHQGPSQSKQRGADVFGFWLCSGICAKRRV